MEKQSKRVTIISRESNERTLDIAMLEAELKARGIEVRVMSRLLTKDSYLKALGYVGHVLKQEAAILASDVVVLDTYCIPASMIPHRKSTKVIQMWHALSAIKRFGWQTVGMEGGSSKKVATLMKMHHGYDYVVCPSDATAESFCEGFRTSRDRIVKQGLPRIDYIKSVAGGARHEDMLSRILVKYPQLKDDSKKIILYAPTFRPGKAVDAGSLITAIDSDKYDLVVKLHPLYRGDTDPTIYGKSGVIFDDEFSSFDWLAAADIVISDYSSLVVESTLADKPLYLYTYDIDEYMGSTGLNMDFDEEAIAPYVFKDAKALADALDKPYDMKALRAFRNKYIDIDTGDDAENRPENYVTARFADFIEKLL